MSVLESLIKTTAKEKKRTFSEKPSAVSAPSAGEAAETGVETQNRERAQSNITIPKVVLRPSQSPGPKEDKLYLPESVLAARDPLGVLCRATLKSNPAASKLTAEEQRWIAEHLQTAVLSWLARFVIPPEEAISAGSHWDACCPRNHPVEDGVFARQLIGWCCESCHQVYPVSECRFSIDGRASTQQTL